MTKGYTAPPVLTSSIQINEYRPVSAAIDTLRAKILLCMQRDRHRYLQRLRAIERTVPPARRDASELAELVRDIERSSQFAAMRLAGAPSPEYPDNLPVVEKKDEIARVIAENQVVIVCGETGSGKTTQLPKICLAAGRGVYGLIGHTQPRRIAARTVAQRIASELKTPLGQGVGYKVRFSDHVSEHTYIKLMTDGILLAESQHDRFLDAYDTLIIDEAHERSLNIDFLLGYLRQLLPKRPDLKLIITSATIDPQRFSRHFNNAPIVEVSGRTYPVEMRYRPLLADDEEDRDRDLQAAIRDAVDELARCGPGDILIFLAGERDIRETAENLRKHHPPQTEILPLFSRLSVADQQRVFQSHPGRRIVLATNVAETSLTVPGIRYVIDTGVARISRYSYRTKVQRLPIEPIAQSSANQRAGRCGRVSAGICIRLYSEEDYQARPAFTEPEILRTNLASVILQMKFLGLDAVEDFPFVEAPDSRYVNDGYKLLHELGALTEINALTETGRRIAALPSDPRFGRMILAAERNGALEEMLMIVSALSIQDPRERPFDRQQAADEKHRRFADEHSDFMALPKLWSYFHEQVRALSNSKFRQLCKQEFLSYLRLREWQDVHQQLKAQCVDMKLRFNQVPADYGAIHRSLLTGLLGNIAMKTETNEYLGARQTKLHVFPGSSVFKKPPKWIVAAEWVETQRIYARTVAKIDPEWIEPLAKHLTKSSYFDAHWEKRNGHVAAYERVTLYGLVIVPKRRIHYGPINPAEARAMFIRHALVRFDYQCTAPFFVHNQKLTQEIGELEAKARRLDILVDEESLFQFYDATIPSDVYSGPAFEKWRIAAEKTQPNLLFFNKQQLMRHDAERITAERFPETMLIDGVTLSLRYHFAPGEPDDGVTALVPLPVLQQLHPQRFDWLVPGLLLDKITALLKCLPKSLRRNFVPVPTYAQACFDALTPSDVSLKEALTQHLKRMTGVSVASSEWNAGDLPLHLSMHYRVIDEQGKELASGRDLRALQQQFARNTEHLFADMASEQFDRSDITRWDFGELPEVVEVQRGGLVLNAYPALVDQGQSVALQLADSPDKARQWSRRGLLRLIALNIAPQLKALRKNIPHAQRMCLHYAAFGQCERLLEDLIDAGLHQTFMADDPQVHTAEQFDELLKRRSTLVSDAQRLCDVVDATLTRLHMVQARLKKITQPLWLPAVGDINVQLKALIYDGFISATPWSWLQQFPRYLAAIERRLDKLVQDPNKDRQLSVEVKKQWDQYLQRSHRHAQLGIEDPELTRFRWLIEELRVSLFAQELKTIEPVSVKRLDAVWRHTREE